MKCCSVSFVRDTVFIPIYRDVTITWDHYFMRIKHKVTEDWFSKDVKVADDLYICESIALREVRSFKEWYEDVEGTVVNPPEEDA